MKRIRHLLILVTICISLASLSSVHAATPNRYKGLFLAQTYQGNYYYWYVQPVTGERFAFSDFDGFSKLLNHAGLGITKKKLQSIPIANESATKNQDTKLIQKLRGAILLTVDADGQAWYVNPLDNTRYFLSNDDKGFQTVKELALGVTNDQLSSIPVTKDYGFDRQRYTSTQTSGANLDIYDTMYETLLQSHYFKEKFTGSDLFYGSLKGMAAATGDKHTEFYTPAQNQQQHQYFSGDTSIEGIGAVINSENSTIYIVSLVDDSPAQKAGLAERDQIISVNGESIAGLSVDAAVSRIKGPSGTPVRLMIYRPSTGVTTEYVVTRAKITLPSVEGKMLDGAIAYFKFNLFTSDLIDQFKPLAAKLLTSETKGIIVDMRNNIGGVTQASVELADYWVDKDNPIFIEHRPSLNITYVGNDGRKLPNVKTVILVNGETASASEIFTSALRYNKLAVVVGTKTYGKGTGQNLINFDDGSGLKYTTFAWTPPDNISIDGVGIVPDYTVQQVAGGDAQLEYAKTIVKN